ncbi:MAG: hypothetical protein V3V01_14350 [Acidimicrobiales bacterium]
MTPQDQFHQLLNTWNHHQELRSDGADLAELWTSRANLDDVRLKAFTELRLAA